MVSLLLSVTFACGVVIAVAHVINRNFIAPVYDVLANLTAFSCAVAASLLLDHWVPAMFSAVAIVCWLLLARRTLLARRDVTHQRAEHVAASRRPWWLLADRQAGRRTSPVTDDGLHEQ
ncbi:MAG TPA: hypothetical protein VFH66_16630 [Mycobacteriales bacterium]|nr:hypothetical protein [Mycobacteriales bacterium]